MGYYEREGAKANGWNDAALTSPFVRSSLTLPSTGGSIDQSCARTMCRYFEQPGHIDSGQRVWIRQDPVQARCMASVRGEMVRIATKSRSSSIRLSRYIFCRVTMSSTPQNRAVSTNGTSPSNGAEQKDDEDWSGEEEEEVGADGSRKRKRPMSVSCELCKSRKVCCTENKPPNPSNTTWVPDANTRSSAI